MSALAWVLVALVTLAALLVVLAVLAATAPPPPRRRPRPYPGCPACLVAQANDLTWPQDNSLELHQMVDHTGGPRW